MPQGDLAATLLFQIRACGDMEVPEREYRFWPGRQFRLDLYFRVARLAVELEGAIWQGGRHTTPAGFHKDIEKYNMLTQVHIALLRYTVDEVENGLAVRGIRQYLGLEALDFQDRLRPARAKAATRGRVA